MVLLSFLRCDSTKTVFCTNCYAHFVPNFCCAHTKKHPLLTVGPPTKCTQLLCAHIAELVLNMCAYKSAAQCALSDLLSYEHGSTRKSCVVRCNLYRGLQFVEKKIRTKPKCWVRPFLKRIQTQHNCILPHC